VKNEYRKSHQSSRSAFVGSTFAKAVERQREANCLKKDVKTLNAHASLWKVLFVVSHPLYASKYLILKGKALGVAGEDVLKFHICMRFHVRETLKLIRRVILHESRDVTLQKLTKMLTRAL
jgi:hypothetical protein